MGVIPQLLRVSLEDTKEDPGQWRRQRDLWEPRTLRAWLFYSAWQEGLSHSTFKSEERLSLKWGDLEHAIS